MVIIFADDEIFGTAIKIEQDGPKFRRQATSKPEFRERM